MAYSWMDQWLRLQQSFVNSDKGIVYRFMVRESTLGSLSFVFKTKYCGLFITYKTTPWGVYLLLRRMMRIMDIVSFLHLFGRVTLRTPSQRS